MFRKTLVVTAAVAVALSVAGAALSRESATPVLSGTDGPGYTITLKKSGKATAGSGVKAALIGTTKRSNGSLQLTYNKHPLYTFVLDKKAGQTNGEDQLAFGARWYAVSGKGTAVVKASPPPTNTTTTAPYPANPYP